MSGILGSKNSKSGRITNICDPFPTYGGLTMLNYLICAYGDVNMAHPDSTMVNNFNADNNVNDTANIRNFLDPTNNALGTNYHWLFGPNYTGADASNGGWRVEITFRVPVKIEQISVASVSTHARIYHFGLFSRQSQGNNTGIIFHQHQFAKVQHTASTRGTASMTAFGSSRNLTSMENTENPHVIAYENAIGQVFLLSFGQSIHNNGNANAGVGSIVIYGHALTD